MKILVIDNYDSFTFNLVHYLEDLGCEVAVWRNDSFELDELEPFQKILLSPGPGVPNEAGLLLPVIKRFAPIKSILGICLGHQAIAEAFGARLVNLDCVHHGVSADISIVANDPIFDGLPSRITVGRYHSWSVAKNIPEVLEITSIDSHGEIMSLRHRDFDLRGVQFHPESVLTPNGKRMLENWLSM